MPKIAVVTVTYGERWQFLKHVIDAVIEDPHLYKLILVDNASTNNLEIDYFVARHKDKVELIRQEKNIGSAGGFSVGMQYAKILACDYVLLLDDDNVPEEGFFETFLNNYKTLSSVNEKVVILGNRSSLKGIKNVFYRKEKMDGKIPTTFFETSIFSRLGYFISLFSQSKYVEEEIKDEVKSEVQVESFAYGGTFMSIQAVKDSKLPDRKLFAFGDDIEYSWSVKRAGYKIYACSTPLIKDIDPAVENSHILGMFAKGTSDFKVYFRIRNAVLISIRNTKHFKIVLAFNIMCWFVGIVILYMSKLEVNKFVFRRISLIYKALYNGFTSNLNIPKYIELPDNADILSE